MLERGAARHADRRRRSRQDAARARGGGESAAGLPRRRLLLRPLRPGRARPGAAAGGAGARARGRGRAGDRRGPRSRARRVGAAARARQLRAPARGVCRARPAALDVLSGPARPGDEQGAARVSAERPITRCRPCRFPTRMRPDELRRSEAVTLFLARAREARPRLAEDDETRSQRRRASPGISTGCRSRSSWRRRAPRRSRSMRSRAACATASGSWSRGAGSARPATARSGKRWTGATSSCPRTNSGSWPAVGVRRRLHARRGGPRLPRRRRRARARARSSGWSTHRSSSPMNARARCATACSRRFASTPPSGSTSPETRTRCGEAHAEWCLYLVEEAEPELTGERQTAWFDVLERERDNVRAALSHLDGAHEPELRLRLTVALTRFWYVRGYLGEGRRWLELARAEAGEAEPGLRRRALTAGASFALLQGDYAVATSLAEESLDVARETGEPRFVANALSNLGAIVLAAGDTERAESAARGGGARSRETSATTGSRHSRSTTSATSPSRSEISARGAALRGEPGLAARSGRYGQRRARTLQPRRRGARSQAASRRPATG